MEPVTDLDAARARLGPHRLEGRRDLRRVEERAGLAELLEGAALDELHHEVRNVVLGAEVVDLHDIGVTQFGDCSCLALEARDALFDVRAPTVGGQAIDIERARLVAGDLPLRARRRGEPEEPRLGLEPRDGLEAAASHDLAGLEVDHVVRGVVLRGRAPRGEQLLAGLGQQALDALSESSARDGDVLRHGFTCSLPDVRGNRTHARWRAS